MYPPTSRPYGASYAQWNARWWQWLYGTDRLSNPVFNEKEGTPQRPVLVDCRAGQSGPVWFLGGTFLPTETTSTSASSTVFRTCRVPAGVALFLPVLNSQIDNLSCPPPATPFGPYPAADLERYAHTNMNGVQPGSTSVTIDGRSVDGLDGAQTAFRSTSPWFSYRLPKHNLGGLPETCGRDFPYGTRPPSVDGHPGAIADGIYVMLAPLSKGTHMLRIRGHAVVDDPNPVPPVGAFDFTQDINYRITVG